MGALADFVRSYKPPVENRAAGGTAVRQTPFDFLMQGLGTAALKAVKFPGRYMQTYQPGQLVDQSATDWGADMALNMVGSPALAGGVPGLGSGVGKGIKAYHGSPHDFDRFDLSKIGTGEGAQVYGHGLYFAENPAVAAQYRKELTGGKPEAGRSYEVEIKADPNKFLDWDKGGKKKYDEAMNALPRGLPWEEYPKLTAQALREQGIPGIKYFDEGSRSAADGTRNYVVFDDKLIDILRKYGLAGIPAAGAAYGSMGAQQQPVY